MYGSMQVGAPGPVDVQGCRRAGLCLGNWAGIAAHGHSGLLESEARSQLLSIRGANRVSHRITDGSRHAGTVTADRFTRDWQDDGG